jgi:thioesterase domain-containing protein
LTCKEFAMTPPDPLEALRTVWRREMPITDALGISIDSATHADLVLRMPLAPNRNHKGTAFAGSLSALATLTGWSLLWRTMREVGETAHVVIQDSTIRYLLPVRSDAIASARLPAAGDVERLLSALRRRGKGRITLDVTIRDETDVVVATFEGRYVVHREDLFGG